MNTTTKKREDKHQRKSKSDSPALQNFVQNKPQTDSNVAASNFHSETWAINSSEESFFESGFDKAEGMTSNQQARGVVQLKPDGHPPGVEMPESELNQKSPYPQFPGATIPYPYPQHSIGLPWYYPKDTTPIISIRTSTASKRTLDGQRVVVKGNHDSFFKQDMKLELHGVEGKFLKVRNRAGFYIDENGNENASKPGNVTYVLIKRTDTNLKTESNNNVERNNIDRDINSFSDNQVASALIQLESTFAKIAHHYRKANETFESAIDKDKKAADLRQKLLFSVLSAVSVGAIGGLAELFSSVKMGIKWSSAVWGSLEDTLQGVVGNVVNLGPDFFSSVQYSTNVSPADFADSADEFVREQKRMATLSLGKFRTDLEHSSIVPDRAEMLIKMHDWYASELISKTYFRNPDWTAYQLTIEKGIWQKYIVTEMQDGGGFDPIAQRYYISYDDPGSETISRWKKTGIISESGADFSKFFQDAWTQKTESVSGDPQGRRHRIWDGNAETRKVVHWALKYNPKDDAFYF